MLDDDFKRILKQRAYDCTPDELDVLLGKYGHDDAGLAQIKSGVDQRLKHEDSGDWTSPATPGWKPAREKKNRLDQFILDRGPASAFRAAAASDRAVEDLRQQVRALEQRLHLLENRIAGQKFKL